MKAKIKRLHSDIELPTYQTGESAGFDLAASVDLVVQPGEIAKVPTGLIIEAPEGHFLAVFNRGSLNLKKGLTLSNNVGVVDRDFAGPTDEIMLLLFNRTSEAVSISKGERLCQGLFLRVDQVEWEEVEDMASKDRGGFGSTGGYANSNE